MNVVLIVTIKFFESRFSCTEGSVRPSYVLPVSLKHVKREDRLLLMNKLGSMSKYLFALLICVSLMTGCGKQDNRSSEDGS